MGRNQFILTHSKELTDFCNIVRIGSIKQSNHHPTIIRIVLVWDILWTYWLVAIWYHWFFEPFSIASVFFFKRTRHHSGQFVWCNIWGLAKSTEPGSQLRWPLPFWKADLECWSFDIFHFTPNLTDWTIHTRGGQTSLRDNYRLFFVMPYLCFITHINQSPNIYSNAFYRFILSLQVLRFLAKHMLR